MATLASFLSRSKRRLRSAAGRSRRDLDEVRIAIGGLRAQSARAAQYERLSDAEFRVFSQFGEDGIIQYLLGRVPIENDQFVEIGVQDYRESNTRFLLCHDNWRGLIIDADRAHIEFIETNPIGWRHTIDARAAFITRENVNEVMADAGVLGDIGLLSLDIDGNDYWVLDAIEAVAPRILVVEYNSTFGPAAKVTIPYDPAFQRTKAHFSGLYWGASLGALCSAADRKGLAFVGSNRAGNNAFFVRRSLLNDLREISSEQGWVDARFRESRDEHGELTFVQDRRDKLRLIGHLPLVDVATRATVRTESLA
jgi:hypothetical protein